MRAFIDHFVLAAPLFVLVAVGYIWVRLNRRATQAGESLTHLVFALALPALLFRLML